MHSSIKKYEDIIKLIKLKIEDQNKIINDTDILVQLNLLDDEKILKLKENQILIGVFNPYSNKEKIESQLFGDGSRHNFF